MQADYRVDRLQIDENTGDVSIICWDNVYEEEFAKYLGNADEEWARDNAAAILDDSSFFMADEVKNELISTFGLEDYGHEMIDIEDVDSEDISFDDIDDDASLLDDEYERPVEEEDFDEESLNYEDETNESFDLREALNRIDLNTNNHYDLLNLYESCNLTEGEKHRLATVVYDDAQPERIYDALNRRYLNNESLEDNLDEAIPAAVMALGTAAASGFGQAVGDKVSSKIFGEDVDNELNEVWEPEFDERWRPEDIELWKSIDWKSRNYKPYLDDSQTFRGEVVAYGLPGGATTAEVMFAKEISPNPIYPPSWVPTTNPFEGTVGFMYDGNTHTDGYKLMDRTETQEVYDMLSESRMDEGIFDKIKGYGKDLVRGIAGQVKDVAQSIQKGRDEKTLKGDVSKDMFSLAQDAGAEVTTTADKKNTVIETDKMDDKDKAALLSLMKEQGIKYDDNLAKKGLLQIKTQDLRTLQKAKDNKAKQQNQAQLQLAAALKKAGITNLSQLKGILDESLDNEFKFRETKSVLDSDGFITDYTWYECADGTHVFVFGDTDVYGPEDGYFDHECDSYEEAREWFDSYNGFDEDDLNESKSINESISRKTLLNAYTELEQQLQKLEDFTGFDWYLSPDRDEALEEISEDEEYSFTVSINCPGLGDYGPNYTEIFDTVDLDRDSFNFDVDYAIEQLTELLGIDDDFNESKSIKEDIQTDEEAVIEFARDCKEIGKPVEDYKEFASILKDDGIHPTEELYQLYLNTYNETDLNEARKSKVRKLKDSENTFNDTELEVKQEPLSNMDMVKKLYEFGGFERLPIGRENAATIEIGAADKSRLNSYFKSKPEFNHEINTENDIISNEFISDKYDIEIFDSFVRAYKIPQNESLDENILEEATLKDKVNAALARYDYNED